MYSEVTATTTNKNTISSKMNFGMMLNVLRRPSRILLGTEILPVAFLSAPAKVRLRFSSAIRTGEPIRSSSTTLPSCILILRVAYASNCSKLCVTTMTSLSLEMALKSSTIPAADSLSRFPVGSSATIISVSLASALAIDTLCFCPPDNLDTLVLA